jgi:hypothetical protein
MEHIRFFLNKKFNVKKEVQEIHAPVSKDTLTDAGARLMALGSERPYRKSAYNVRLYQP